jgi:sugar transferase (PEP-CTERM/EpsH1 system associated)
MRILMLAHRIPYPPETGDKVRAFHIARHLARQHDLTLAFLVDDPKDLPGLEALGAEIGQVEFATLWRRWGLLKGLASLASGGPATLPYFGSRQLRTRIASRLAGAAHDLIYVSSSSMAPYAAAHAQIPVMMDFVDVDSDKWTQYSERTRPPLAWLYRTEGLRLRRYEGQVARWARLCILATAADEALLKSFAPWAVTTVIPNGVDLDRFAPAAEPASQPTLIFTGAMDYFPNVDAVTHFCTAIYPAVRRAVPAARCLIVGLNPAPAVQRLAELPGVTVTGAVPDVRPYYQQAAVCVAPLRMARGIQNKVLQAMAMGLPVVATRRACEGIEARPDHELIVEDDPEAFASRIVALLESPALRAELGRRGRAFVEARHSWPAALGLLDDLLASATRVGGASAEAPARSR